jgi:hypothetical protein
MLRNLRPDKIKLTMRGFGRDRGCAGSSALPQDESRLILLQVDSACRPYQDSLNLGPGPRLRWSDVSNDIEPCADLQILVLKSIENLADVDLCGVTVLRSRKVVEEG